jgi:hypothetical protein
LATVFGRFAIKRARLTMLPTSGFVEALPSYRSPMAIGYFNDSVAASTPGSYSSVLADEQAKLISPFAIDPKSGMLDVKIACPLDPWSPTTGTTAA